MSVNYDFLEKRWAQYWSRSNDDRPIMSIYAPEGKRTPADFAWIQDHSKRWLDTEFQLKRCRNSIENTRYLGEAFPAFNPDLGPDFLGAVCGCDIEFGETTSWAKPCLEDYSSFPEIKFDKGNKWWLKMQEITAAALEDSKGEYIVGLTDLHAGADGLVSLRGSENTAFDIYDHPEDFKKRVFEILPVFKEVATLQHNMISQKQKFCSNWTGIIHPNELWYPTSCDFSCMISEDCFEEFIIPELTEEIDWLHSSIYHLDGVGALRHLDRLLQIPKLKGIQWVPGEGQPSAGHWIDVLKKIQSAGKCIQIHCQPDDIAPLCENLDPQGLNIVCWAPDIESGETLIRDAERIYKEKRAIF